MTDAERNAFYAAMTRALARQAEFMALVHRRETGGHSKYVADRTADMIALMTDTWDVRHDAVSHGGVFA
jgi:hypothetical protein